MITSQTVTAFLEQQLPDYVQEFYPMFVIFVTKYYEWLEQGGNPQNIIQNIRYNNDIDSVASSLLTRFMTMYFIPALFCSNLRTITGILSND